MSKSRTKKQPSSSSSSESTQKSRPTIGLICDIPWTQYSRDMWAGVRDAARELDANLLYFAGGVLDFALNYRRQANVIYERVMSGALDGLVIWGGQLAHIVGAKEVFKFCQRFQPLPMISIELEMEGIPSLTVDNHRGVYDLVSHLIEDHGFTRLAYIDYPTNYPATIARYQGYADALKDHGIIVNPQLITDGTGGGLSGEYKDVSAGYAGIRVLFDQRNLRPGRDIEAIVAVADPTALTALRGLHERSIRVPQDVALVGFDDIDEVRYQRPPLTTVRQSFYEQGKKAAEALLSRLRGGHLPERIELPPEVVVRRSCGCEDPVIKRVANKPSFISLPPLAADCEEVRCVHREVLLSALRRADSETPTGIQQLWAERLLDSFMNEIQEQEEAQFLTTLEEIFYEASDLDRDLLDWQNVLSEWRHLFPALPEPARMPAETLWQQARVLLADLIHCQQAYRSFQSERYHNILHEMTHVLLFTPDIHEFLDVLAEMLPQLDILSCYLAVYENPADPAGAARLILAYDEDGRHDLPPEGLPIPPRHLLPDVLACPDEVCSLMVAPLYFQTTALGFALFGAGQSDGRIYESLRNRLCGALQGVLSSSQLQHV